MKQRRSEAERTGGEERIVEGGTPLCRFRTGDRERISGRKRIGERTREETMSKRKSTFVREIQRMDRRESWRNKHVRKEANRTGDDTASDEQAQSPTEAEKVKEAEETKT